MAKKPITIPVGPWLPDRPDFDNPGSVNVRNCIPRTDKTYGPLGSPSVYSGAIGSACQGAASFLDPSGNVHLFAADATDLWHLVSGSPNWTKVSKLGGYAPGTGVVWNFEYYNGIVIATDYVDNPQAFTLVSSALFADLAGSPPKAKYCAFVRGFLVFVNTFDGVGGAQPQRVWWSGAGNPTSWPTPGSQAAAQVQSSFNDLFGRGGGNQGIVGNLGNADAAVFQEHAVWRMMYAGPPNVFDFLPAEGVKGCPAPNSITQIGNVAYYLGEDGFYAFDGQSSTPIGLQKIDKTFYADLDQSNIDRVVGTVDPINKQVIWAYPGAGNSNGNPNHLLFYNWALDRWSIADVTCEFIVRMLSIGYTLDQLWTVLGYKLDNLPFPLDSRVWTGGLPLLGLFDTSHKLNYLTGNNLAPTIDTVEMQPIPGKLLRYTNARPLTDGGTPSVAIGRRNRLQDAVSFAPVSAMNALGNCTARGAGRYIRGRITLPANSSFTHIMGMELEGSEAGSR